MGPQGPTRQGPDGEYFSFHGSWHLYQTPQVPKSLQKQPQTVYKHTGAACAIKTIHRNRRLSRPRVSVSLCLLPWSLSTQTVRRPLACPGALSHRDAAARSTDGQRAMPAEGLRGPFPEGSASALIFICLKTQAREY